MRHKPLCSMRGTEMPVVQSSRVLCNFMTASREDMFQLSDIDASGPACWGPPQWMALHQLLRGYPRENASPEKQAALKSYVQGLAGIIPCNACAQHWKALADTVATGSRAEALKWSIDVHNAVNIRTGKKMYSYAEALALLRDTCPDNRFQCSNKQETAASTAPTSVYGVTIGALLIMVVAVVVILIAAVLIQKSTKTTASATMSDSPTA